jgi:hypothetical protein
MNVTVAHMTKITENGITASARIAKFLHDRLSMSGLDYDGIHQCNLVHTKETCEAVTENQDVLFVVNGPMAFCDFLPELGALVDNSQKVIWVQNDIICKAPSTQPNNAQSPFRAAFARYGKPLDYWTTLPSMATTPDSRYINWNMLTYVPFVPTPDEIVDGICYYGAFREDRKPYFERYLNTDLYPVNISTTVPKKFKTVAPLASYTQKFSNPLAFDLSKYEATVYIEDELSHKVYCSPANRFYEALSAGVAIAVDHRAANTLQEAGLELKPEWIVKDDKDVENFLCYSDVIARDQNNAWNRDYLGDLTYAVDKAIREVL